jgi:flagellar motility protein MotE (MotC chaperone)
VRAAAEGAGDALGGGETEDEAEARAEVERSWAAAHEAGEELDAARAQLMAERMDIAAVRAQLAQLQAQHDSLKAQVGRRWTESVSDNTLFSPPPTRSEPLEGEAPTPERVPSASPA